MKLLATILAAGAILTATVWHNRVALAIWGLPIVAERAMPIGKNVPISWRPGPDVAAAEPGERPPNIILILADDMGFNDVSLYNGGAADGSLMTPNIDAIALEGVRFNRGYAGNPVCAPSRAAIMTGRYSTRFGFEFTPFPKMNATLGMWMTDKNPPPRPVFIDEIAVASRPPVEELGLPASEIAISELLQHAGYYTAHIGKWHLGQSEGMHPLDRGFDESLGLTGLLYLPADHPEAVNAKRTNQNAERLMWGVARYGVEWGRGNFIEPNGYLTDYLTNEAVAIIDNNRHQPFFLYLAHWAPHNPLQAKQSDYDALSHIEDHHTRVYAAMLTSLDRSIERIEQALADNGLTENTLIIFASDNGAGNYVGLPNLNKPFRGWKSTHFEGGIRVPFMAKWPARIAEGAVIDTPVHHFDIFHTIAAAAGVEVPEDRQMDGVNLLPFVTGEAEGAPHDTLFWLHGHHQAVLHNGWKLIVSGRPANGRWLFNLATDPTETTNLASEEPERLAALEQLLAAHVAEQAEPLWMPLMESAQRIDHHGEVPHDDDEEYIYWPD